MTDWTSMRRQDFDDAAPLTLFDLAGGADQSRPDDKCGTPDLFAG